MKQLISFLQSYGLQLSGPDPIDYKIWEIMQQREYEMQTRVRSASLCVG